MSNFVSPPTIVDSCSVFVSTIEWVTTVETMSPSPVEELALSDLDRSNKGASKQRRDLINGEIAVMRDLLPLTESARQRLSQLQVMSLSCVFIRKCNVLRQLFSSLPAETDLPTMCDFAQALTGFLLITTREGKLVYISENVTDYLGHSMVDMKTQGDSLYDIVDKRDEASVRAHLLQGGKAQPDIATDVAFFCRMNMSRTLKRQSAFGDVKVMHVKGHFLPLSDPSAGQQSQQQQQQYVFMATCSPLITPELKECLIQSNTMVFKTVHKMDMSFLEVTKTAEYHLGCSTEHICKTSWYSMLHPEDIHEAREKHVLLMRANHELGCMMTVRMLTMKGEILWVNMVMQVRQPTNSQNDDGLIICINQVISEDEAFQVRMQSHMFSLYPPRTAELWNTATLGQPQPVQTEPVCWMPASSSSSSSSSMALPVPGLSNPMTSCQAVVQPRQAMPTASYINGHQPAGSYHHSPPPSSSPTAMLSSSGHTDKLKLMLKRKLQGPCQPAKIPKMDENPTRTGRSPSSRQHFERCATTSPLTSSQFKTSGNVPGAYSWSAASQVTSQVQRQVAHALPVLVSHPQNMEASMLASPPSRGSVSPPLSMPGGYQGTEQVVPQSELKVVVPESFLTPDSSPASSPDPQTPSNSFKVKPGGVPASAVLKDLGQLAAFVQTKNAATARPSAGTGIKMEPNMEECRHAGRRRELPVMDASDIESFFHFLDSGKQFTAMDVEKTKQWQTTLQEMSASLENRPVFKAAVPAMQGPHIKQEMAAMDQGPSPTGPQQQKIQGTAKKAEQTQQSEADFKELEELLSFFSGEMTATQLNLDNLMGSPVAEAEVEKLDSSQLQHGRKGGQVCGAGYPDSFLLPGSGLDCPREGFSPVSPSDLSGEEDSSSEDPMDKLNRPVMVLKGQDGEMHGCAHLFGPPPAPSHPQAPQDVPGISEDDELYQLDKLLALMASDSGVMLFQDSQ